jgi:hypothetical protein
VLGCLGWLGCWLSAVLLVLAVVVVAWWGGAGMSTRKSVKAAAQALNSMDDEAPPAHPPAPTAPKDEDVADDATLNDEELFSTSNFKSGTAGLNERGRGAFAAACICVLEQLENTEGHVNATRATGRAKCERWQLNRMPGRTDACLLFVNAIFGPILGLKPFPSWRALARALGAFAHPPGPRAIPPSLDSTAHATRFRCACRRYARVLAGAPLEVPRAERRRDQQLHQAALAALPVGLLVD